MHDFFGAFQLLKDGQKVTRGLWSETWKDAWISMTYLPVPGDPDKAKRPFIYFYKNGEMNPWVITQADVFAEDYEVMPIT